MEEGQDCIQDGKLDKEYLSIKLHPDYSVDKDHHHHDIALIEINLTEKYSDFLRPICLPEPGRLNGLHPNATLTVCGWGWTDFFQAEHGNTSSPIKMKARLPYVDHATCQKLYPNLPLKPGQICAGGRRQDACAGDSGSPLMYYDRFNGMWILSGIVSKGPKTCGTVGHPGIYSSVVEYLPWIKNVTGL